MAEHPNLWLPNDRLDPRRTRPVRVAASFNDLQDTAYAEEVELLAPKAHRPDFQQDALNPLLVIAIDDLVRATSIDNKLGQERLVRMTMTGDVSVDLLRIGFLLGEFMHTKADFRKSFKLEPEQVVRLSRYTVWGQDPTLEVFQRDTIQSHFNLSNLFALGIVQAGIQDQMLADPNAVDLRFYGDLMAQPWFKSVTYRCMDTGNDFWGPQSPGTGDGPSIEELVTRAQGTASWWEVKGQLPEGPVSITQELRDLLVKRKADANEGIGYGVVGMKTNGCPVRHLKATYSENPADVNYLTPRQIARLTRVKNPLVRVDSVDPHILHIQFSVIDYFSGRFQEVIKKVTS